MSIDTIHHFNDPAKLTPYEEKLLALRNQGMSYGEMVEALNGSSNYHTIAARFKIIREKLEVIEAEREYNASK